MDAPTLSRDYLERQLIRVKRVTTLSYLFTLLAFPLLAYGMARGRFGVVLAGVAWLAISLLQRYRAARVRSRIEERLRDLDEPAPSSS
ncbi:hypothetical protein BH24DEI1_BH24DEI1_17640 [soil metagenome]|jgi:Flp pilus assembly protein TadB|nr:hypothetical protein [Deinococcota bacterium]